MLEAIRYKRGSLSLLDQTQLVRDGLIAIDACNS